MSYLFDIEGNHVIPHKETLLISPFKEIWERDKKKDKSVAIMELSYCEFMASNHKTNPFREYGSNKSSSILNSIKLSKKWEADFLVLKGIEAIKDFEREGSLNYRLYASAHKTLTRLIDDLGLLDIKAKNEKTGSLLYKPKDILSALNEATDVLKSFNEIKKKVDEDFYDIERFQANKRISLLADPDSLKS